MSTQKKLSTKKLSHRDSNKGVFLLFSLLFQLFLNTANAQQADSIQSPTPTAPSAIINEIRFSETTARFTTGNIELKTKERFITNSIVIKNNKAVAIRFNVELVYPNSWKLISNFDKTYEIPAGDSLVVPVRIIPGISAVDGIIINIQALLVSEDQGLLADASFIVHRKKDIRWTVRSESGDRIYFPVNDSIVPFSINVNNEGNEKIDLLLSKKQLGNKIQVEEVTPDPENKQYNELILAPETDTTLDFNATLQKTYYNNQRIDIENYSPSAMNEEMRNTLFFQSQLSNNTDGRMFSGSRRLDFIRLSDQKMLNPYGSACIPLIVDANMYNILGLQPIMRVDMRGSTMLSNQAILGYQTQFNFTRSTYNNQITRDLFYRLSYSTKRGEVQAGNISGGLSLIPISGKGISGSYFVTPDLRVGAYYVQSRINAAEKSHAYGGFTRYQYKKIGNATLQYGRTIFEESRRENTYAGISTAVRVLPTQQLSFGYAISRNDYKLIGETKTGNSLSAGYAGSFFHKKLYTYLRGSLFSANYGANSLPSAHYFHRSGYTPGKNWSIVLQNTLSNYQQNSIINQNAVIVKNHTSYNQLFFNFNKREARFMPSVFYNATELNTIRLIYRGVGMDYSKSTLGGRSRMGISIRGGYNKLPDYSDIKDYFTLQFTYSAMIKTFSFNTRYYYGPQYVSDPQILRNSFKYPQSIFFSAQQQWQPRNKHFVFQASANYSYMNQFNRHSFGFYPEAYYFNRTKWRFKLSPGYSVNSSKSERAVQTYQGEAFPETAPSRVVTHNFYLNVGVRKEFGIPVPKKWTKHAFTNLNFTAFLDANGNKIKDKNEVVIKNVVIRVGNDEVITNEEGKAGFSNIAGGTYSLKTWSLYELNGWYPLVDDSIFSSVSDEVNIPFVKGIKLNGNITLQKERYSGVNATVDLSRILITAINESGKKFQAITDNKGNYVLYLPPGKYFLNMDEGFVGKGFIVLKNNAEISLQDIESYNYNFYILEKKRKMNIKKFGEEDPEKKP
ncbi:hypothetical protein BH11BAC2_BH11BAC2_13320 [soil metagenome]